MYEFRNSKIKVGHDDDLWNLFERINPPRGMGGGEEEWHKDSTGLTRLWLWSFWHGVDISVYMCIYVSSPRARWAGLQAWAIHNPHCSEMVSSCTVIPHLHVLLDCVFLDFTLYYCILVKDETLCFCFCIYPDPVCMRFLSSFLCVSVLPIQRLLIILYFCFCILSDCVFLITLLSWPCACVSV